MKDNPLHTEPGTVYLVGPAKGANGLPNGDFERIASAIAMEGLSVICSNKIVHHAVDKAREDDMCLRKRIAYLAMCDLVVNLEGWEKCPESLVQIQIARALNKPVIFAEMIHKKLNILHTYMYKHAG